jgi:dihydrofolate reductase
MRKLIAALFLTLDGVSEAPQDWNSPYFNDEMGAEIGQSMASADALLLGRRTYEEWASYWPHQSTEGDPFAAFINNTPKYVASTTLKQLDWDGSYLLGDDVAGEVSKLKQEPGKDIIVNGSATLVRSLLADGLIDELRLMIHPVVVGTGARLFENGVPKAALELVDSRAFATGVVSVAYRPASS